MLRSVLNGCACARKGRFDRFVIFFTGFGISLLRFDTEVGGSEREMWDFSEGVGKDFFRSESAVVRGLRMGCLGILLF